MVAVIADRIQTASRAADQACRLTGGADVGFRSGVPIFRYRSYPERSRDRRQIREQQDRADDQTKQNGLFHRRIPAETRSKLFAE
jgi:hypothetical protein